MSRARCQLHGSRAHLFAGARQLLTIASNLSAIIRMFPINGEKHLLQGDLAGAMFLNIPVADSDVAEWRR
jgi:hypothetical protein